MMTDTAALLERLNQTIHLPVRVANALLEGLRINRMEANEIVVSPGNYANAIYYVHSGIVRGSVDGTSGKITTWFKREGDIIIPQGVFNQRYSEEYISVLTNSVFYAIPIKHIQKLNTSFPEIMELVVLLLSEQNFHSHQREKFLRLPAALDRYNYLARNEGFVLKRIPHYLIASYLNVSKETFSRLNKGLPY